MKYLTTAFLIIFLALNANGQQPSWVWAKAADYLGPVSGGMSIASDNAGNIFLTGTLTVSFPVGSQCLFLLKCDSYGDTLWMKTTTFVNDDDSTSPVLSEGLSVKVDDAGNIYVAGNFVKTLVFAGDTLTSKGAVDVLLLKYNQNGDEIWGRSGGSPYADAIINDVMCIKDGNVFITGGWGLNNQSSTPATAQFDNVSITSYGSTDNFIVSYDTAGNVRWAKSLGGASNDLGVARNTVSADSSGNIYVGGGVVNTSYLGTIQLNSSGFFVAKSDSNGNFQWAQMITGPMAVGPFFATDDAGNVYFAGIAWGTISFGTQSFSGSAFLAKYDNSGTVLWVKDLGSAWNFSITVDLSGAYVIGQFSGTYINGSDTLISLGYDDVFVSKFDVNGNALWTTQAGGANGDDGSDIALSAGDVVVCGTHLAPINFGNIQVPGAGIFISKLSQPTGINDIVSGKGTVSVYPNPNSGSFTVDFHGEDYRLLSITDITGKVLYTQQVDNSIRPEFKLSLANGMYFVRLGGEGKSVMQKFIVQH